MKFLNWRCWTCHIRVDDEALYEISKRCPELLQLSLQNCSNITIKGVIHVVKNCTQLREINLYRCHEVNAKAVVSMVLLRPSLRKIAAPPDFPLSDENRKFFSSHGCLLEWTLKCKMLFCWDLLLKEITYCL